MIISAGPNDERLLRYLDWAITRERPLTITYLKQAKDADSRLRWYIRNGVRKPLLEPTVRTIEPWVIEKEGTPHAYVRGMDRDTGEPRSWRLDRIFAVTYHSRGRQIIPAYVSMSERRKA